MFWYFAWVFGAGAVGASMFGDDDFTNHLRGNFARFPEISYVMKFIISYMIILAICLCWPTFLIFIIIKAYRD